MCLTYFVPSGNCVAKLRLTISLHDLLFFLHSTQAYLAGPSNQRARAKEACTPNGSLKSPHLARPPASADSGDQQRIPEELASASAAIVLSDALLDDVSLCRSL